MNKKKIDEINEENKKEPFGKISFFEFLIYSFFILLGSDDFLGGVLLILLCFSMHLSFWVLKNILFNKK